MTFAENLLYPGVSYCKFCRQWRSQPKMFGPASSAEGASFVGGYGGILPRKILKTRTSEMPFPAI